MLAHGERYFSNYFSISIQISELLAHSTILGKRSPSAQQEFECLLAHMYKAFACLYRIMATLQRQKQLKREVEVLQHLLLLKRHLGNEQSFR